MGTSLLVRAIRSSMKRRGYLATLLGYGFVQLAGCSAIAQNKLRDQQSSKNRPNTETKTPEAIAERGDPEDICEQSVRPSTQIKAILEPEFASDWADVPIQPKYSKSGELGDRETVIGLKTDRRSRAYPLSVLNVHEIVNEVFNVPLMITYCPLCRSAIVANRRIQSQLTTFHVSGLLWDPPEASVEVPSQAKGALPENGANRSALVESSNLIMYDRLTGSFWSQLLGKAICGPLEGLSLEILPFEIRTWANWLDSHPETEVLLPPPHSSTIDTDQ